MKPKLLDTWTMSRVSAPEKASTKFFFSKLSNFTFLIQFINFLILILKIIGTNNFFLADQLPFTYTNIYGSHFGDAPDSSLPKR